MNGFLDEDLFLDEDPSSLDANRFLDVGRLNLAGSLEEDLSNLDANLFLVEDPLNQEEEAEALEKPKSTFFKL